MPPPTISQQHTRKQHTINFAHKRQHLRRISKRVDRYNLRPRHLYKLNIGCSNVAGFGGRGVCVSLGEDADHWVLGRQVLAKREG